MPLYCKTHSNGIDIVVPENAQALQTDIKHTKTLTKPTPQTLAIPDLDKSMSDICQALKFVSVLGIRIDDFFQRVKNLSKCSQHLFLLKPFQFLKPTGQ